MHTDSQRLPSHRPTSSDFETTASAPHRSSSTRTDSLASLVDADSPVMTAADVPVFFKEKHISYWLRCLRSPLPTAYTSTDSNRLTLAFFTVSALDLLGVLFNRTTKEERGAYIAWIYSCQHPAGGFLGYPLASPKTNDHGGTRDEGKHGADRVSLWNVPTMPATYFALVALSVLGDDLKKVKRGPCLRWLRQMQRPDGSFGELLGEDDQVKGGMDTRFAYFATVIRWVLRGDVSGDIEGESDFHVDLLVKCIRGSETYDGGISEEPFHEAHGRLPPNDQDRPPGAGDPTSTEKPFGISSRHRTVRWLTLRLTTTIEEEEMDSPTANFPPYRASSASEPSAKPGSLAPEDNPTSASSFQKFRSMPASYASRPPAPPQSNTSAMPGAIPVHWTGFNGRPNKIADTCYAWWVGASLKILDALTYVDIRHTRCYLLEKTQHLMAGGFGKLPGDPPDIYHSYLGLASLAIIDGEKDDGAFIGPDVEDAKRRSSSSAVVDETRNVDVSVDINTEEEESKRRESRVDNRVLRALDPVLCMSVGARRWIESLQWRGGEKAARA
ncbi:MAG: hypothetical protein M1831_003840 [Alyxoria varia]|nr:MAG: hypothetical protein M1831_003840 [Alyxoria varia]